MKGASSTHLLRLASTRSGSEFQLSTRARRKIWALTSGSGSGSPRTATSAATPLFRCKVNSGFVLMLASQSRRLPGRPVR